MFGFNHQLLVLGALSSFSMEGSQSREKNEQFLSHVNQVFFDATPFTSLERVTFIEAGESLNHPILQHLLLKIGVVMILLDFEVLSSNTKKLDEYARLFKINEPALQHLVDIKAKRYKKLQKFFKKSSYNALSVKRNFQKHGWLGGFHRYALMKGWLGAPPIPKISERYHALQDLPENTLGHQLWKTITDNQFSFPGEKGGFIETVIWHDLVHVLGDYNTSFAGEVEVAGFQSGFIKHGFYLMVFLFLQYHLGVKISLIAQPAIGTLNDTELQLKLIRAWRRGELVEFDFTDNWDFYSDLNQPVDTLRKKYKIPEKL